MKRRGSTEAGKKTGILHNVPSAGKDNAGKSMGQGTEEMGAGGAASGGGGGTGWVVSGSPVCWAI